MAKSIERVPFRYLVMGCCGINICWVNPRLPTYCPECGKMCYPQVRGWVLVRDDFAELRAAVDGTGKTTA